LAGVPSGRRDVLWCFSQVKGTIDVGVTEGRFHFPLCCLRSRSIHLLPTSCTGLSACWGVEGEGASFSLLISLCRDGRRGGN
uniref:Uncharacterized protein n=1 Tax=Coturnix japonica TaxID=93934 RepID=A0A8C2UFJ2_COTJA